MDRRTFLRVAGAGAAAFAVGSARGGWAHPGAASSSAARFIPVESWLGDVFTPVSYLTAHTGVPGDVWQGKFVTVQRSWSGDEPAAAGQRNATFASYG